MRGFALLLVGSTLGASGLAQAGSFYCEAQGVYSGCQSRDGWETCRDQVATGGGAGTTQAKAETDAYSSCMLHMTNMVITGNYPTGSSEYTQRSSVKQNCQITGCREYQDDTIPDQPPPAQTFANETDRFLAEAGQRIKEGDVAGAVSATRQARSVDPARPEPYALLAYLAMAQGDFRTGCAEIAAGLEALPGNELMQLSTAECWVYKHDSARASLEAGRILAASADPDIRTGAAMVQWVAESLMGHRLASCAALVSNLSQRSAAPQWDLNIPIAFLAIQGGSEVTWQLIELLGRLGAEGLAARGFLATACGEAP